MSPTWCLLQVELDGCAALQQSAVFVTTRPVAGHVEVQLMLNIRQGQRKRPFICLSFSYTLAQLLEFSPARPAGFEAWTALLRNRLPGIRVRPSVACNHRQGLTVWLCALSRQ